MSELAIDQTIRQYYKEQCGCPVARGRSWDHCNRFFRKHWRNLRDVGVQDRAALHLGFYLASWGMYRGSSFLLQRDYSVHRPVIRVLASTEFAELWQQRDIGTDPEDRALAAKIMDLVEKVDAKYREADAEYKEPLGKKPQKSMDLVVTKVLLGTVGCLPARDTYFERGFKAHFKLQGVPYGSLNRKFVDNILQFCIDHRPVLSELQPKIVDLKCRPYPLMKLVDMHFWQIGSNLKKT